MPRFIWPILLLLAGNAHAQTLGGLIQEHGLRPPLSDSARLFSRSIKSYTVGSNNEQLAIAYLTEATLAGQHDSLHVSVYQKTSGNWRHIAFAREPGLPPLRTSGAPQQPRTPDIGIPARVDISSDHIFVGTRRTPSAGTVLVLSKSLESVAALDGWIELILPWGGAVYQRSTVHFAPTHPARLSLFDPRSKRDVVLYPTQPYAMVKQRYIEQVKEIYARLGDDWFRINNHHMMAEQFETSIRTPVSNETGTRIAFIAMFGEGGGSRAATPLVEVLVVCDAIQTLSTCSEEELSATRIAHPEWSTERILRDALLRR